MLFHYEGIAQLDPNLLTSPEASSRYTHLALLGVERFFLISGFVILMSAESADSAKSFLLGRTARIYPAYVVSVIPAALAEFSLRGFSWDLFALVAINLTMLRQFLGVSNLIPPYWSLAYELWFYIGIAVVVRLQLLPHIATLCLCWLAVFLPLHFFHWANFIDLSYGVRLLTFIDFGSFFIIGMMIYLLSTGRHSPFVFICLLLATLYNALGRWDWANVSSYSYFAATIMFEVILVLAAKSRIRMLEATPLVWLGKCSYSLYLLHVPIGLLLWEAARRAGMSPMVGVVAAVPLSIGLSTLFRQ